MNLPRSTYYYRPAAKAEGRTLEGLGIQPVTMAAILPTYLVQYRVHGQYTGSGKAA